jgi:hypothetical protein
LACGAMVFVAACGHTTRRAHIENQVRDRVPRLYTENPHVRLGEQLRVTTVRCAPEHNFPFIWDCAVRVAGHGSVRCEAQTNNADGSFVGINCSELPSTRT